MKRLDAASLARFKTWPQNDIPRAVAFLDQDAKNCARRLNAETVNFIIQRLPPHDFLNRHRRELAIASKNLKPAIPDTYPDLFATIERVSSHWLARALSPQQGAQDEARMIEKTLRLRNAYLWFLVGKKVCALNAAYEPVYWKVRIDEFKPMVV